MSYFFIIFESNVINIDNNDVDINDIDIIEVKVRCWKLDWLVFVDSKSNTQTLLIYRLKISSSISIEWTQSDSFLTSFKLYISSLIIS